MACFARSIDPGSIENADPFAERLHRASGVHTWGRCGSFQSTTLVKPKPRGSGTSCCFNSPTAIRRLLSPPSVTPPYSAAPLPSAHLCFGHQHRGGQGPLLQNWSPSIRRKTGAWCDETTELAGPGSQHSTAIPPVPGTLTSYRSPTTLYQRRPAVWNWMRQRILSQRMTGHFSGTDGGHLQTRRKKADPKCSAIS